MKRENFYRRDPGLALQGMSSMSLEERGVYNTVIDLLYLTWRPLEDDPGYIAGHCRCAVQKLNPILRRLIEREKLVRFVENGRSYISNPTFERERTDVKGPSKTRSGRAGVGEKSGEVWEKLASVEKNPALLDADIEQNQCDTALDKSRVDESRHSEPKGSSQRDTRTSGLSPEFKKPPPNSRGTRLPPDWAPGFAEIEYAGTKGLDHEEITRVAEDFRDYWIAKPGADGRKADWTATWQRWVRSHIDRRRPVASRPGQPRGGGQGATDFASIVAQRRGFDGA